MPIKTVDLLQKDALLLKNTIRRIMLMIILGQGHMMFEDRGLCLEPRSVELRELAKGQELDLALELMTLDIRLKELPRSKLEVLFVAILAREKLLVPDNMSSSRAIAKG